MTEPPQDVIDVILYSSSHLSVANLFSGCCQWWANI